MTQKEAEKISNDFNRREFIKGASFGSLMLAMGGLPLQADDAKTAPEETHYSPQTPPVACAVIGCGVWGREIIQTLALLPGPGKPGEQVIPNAPVVAICDILKRNINRAKEFAPQAQIYDDYKKLLEQKDVEAVIVATPTHLHREIVEAALKAGKHVYCEAPIAHTVEDARAIAVAAKAAEKVNFQVGLQMRSDPAKLYVRDFIRSGAIGKVVMARAQSHKKESWRRPGSTPELEKAANWRLDKSISTGLAGEVGIQQLDLINWFLNERPAEITGFGGIMNWNDGRDVADTIQAVLQFPSKANLMYDATRCNSFEGDYEIIYGIDAATLMRVNKLGDRKAWLFQEADAHLLGWEVMARKENVGDESGISLAADASHSVKAAEVKESPFLVSSLHHSLKAFIDNSYSTAASVSAFFAAMGDGADGLGEQLASQSKYRKPAAGYKEGYEATVTAIKVNEAVMRAGKIELPKELFEI
jgi:predicted dehydrogenase